MHSRLYPRVARAWAWVFLIVGCLFLLIPSKVGQDLTATAHFLGLNGTITTPADNLWYVLSLSLMSAITVCAFWSARHPHQLGVYYALLVAKGVSTVGFTALAVTQAPAWIVCAIGDGFVGLTLWLSHHYSVRAVSLLRPDFATRFHGQSPFYEVWFGKIDIAPGQAFWFRYTLLNGQQREAGTWAILFNNGTIGAGKDTTTLKSFVEEPHALYWGGSRLDAQHAQGQAGDIKWDISFHDEGRHFEHVPKAFQLLGLAKSTLQSCYLDLRCSGTIEKGDQEIHFDKAPGMIGHIHGKHHAYEWAWAHCNSFDTADEDIVFEGLSARIRLGGKPSSPLSSFVLYVGKRRYAFSSVRTLMSAKSDFRVGQWSFRTSCDGVILEGQLSASPQQVAVVTYTDTDGTPLWCHNSKLASLKLHLVDSKENMNRTFISEKSAAFEVVNRQKPETDVLL